MCRKLWNSNTYLLALIFTPWVLDNKQQMKLELWVTSLSDTPHLQYYDVQTLEYRYISKLIISPSKF
jgi:hypothetical protein